MEAQAVSVAQEAVSPVVQTEPAEPTYEAAMTYILAFHNVHKAGGKASLSQIERYRVCQAVVKKSEPPEPEPEPEPESEPPETEPVVPESAAVEIVLADLLSLSKDYKAKTAVVKFVERFDADALNHILMNKEKYAELIRPEKQGLIDNAVDIDPFVLSGKYLAKSKGGNATPEARMVAVEYHQANSHGRFFAVGQLSLQSLIREIRHTISRKYYKDIDIKNAHPVFLLHFCDKLGLEAPYLKDYITNRENFLKSIYPENTNLAKKVVLAMLNGGTSDFKKVPNKPRELYSLKSEISRIHDVIAKGEAFKAHKDWLKKKRKVEKGDNVYNAAGSYVNTLFCQFENRILQTVWKVMGSPRECVLCFDGIMVPIDLAVNLDGLSEAVFAEHGIRITLVQKDMTEGFDLSAESVIPYVPVEAISRQYYFGNYDIFAPNPNVLEPVLHNEVDVIKYFKETQIYIKNGAKGYLLTKNKEYSEGVEREYVVYKAVKETDPPFSAPHKVCHFDVNLSDGSTKPMFEFYRNNCQTNGYETAQFIPYLIKNPSISKDVFNTFGGYRFDYECRSPNIAPASISRILAHKRDIICSGNAYAYEYYCRWIAHLIQRPTQMMPISMFIKTREQGTGKTRETTQLACMLGEAYTLEINKLDSVTTKFNSIMLDKLLIIGNDVADKGGFEIEAIRSLISEKKKVVEVKGVDSRQADIYARIMLTSNHDCSLLFTEDNRRWVALNPLATMKGNKAYWDALTADIENASIQRDAFLYFANYPIDEPWVDETGHSAPWNWEKHPKTERTTIIKEANMNPVLVFLKAGIDGDIPELRFTPFMGDDEKSSETPSLVEVLISHATFYEVYSAWHRDNAYKAIKKALDVRRDMETLGFPKKVIKLNCARVNGYTLCPKRILAEYHAVMG
jgi:hypothetical protein